MLQLVLDQNGNYEYKDVASPKVTPVLNSEFEAYESKQKIELAGDTNIGEQTKQLIRETPGQYTTSFNEETGQFETKTKGTEISSIPVDTSNLQTTTEDPNKLTPLQQVERLTAATKPTPIDYKGIAQDTFQAFKPTFKEKALDTALQAGSDIAVSYITNKLLSKTFAGSLATSSPFMTSPYTAAAAFAFDTGVGKEVLSGAKQVAKKVVSAPKKVIKAVSSAVGTVICTELYKQNLMSKEDHRLSWNFTIDNFSNTHINGYWYWAVPMVKLMKKNKLITKFWNHIMSNRTKDIKWRLKKGKFNLLGRLYSMLIENGSYAVGKLISKKHKEVLV